MSYDNRHFSARGGNNNPRSPSPLVRLIPPPIYEPIRQNQNVSPLLRNLSPSRPNRRQSRTDIFTTYMKMIDVGVPEQTVEDVMILDGISDVDIDTFLMNLTGQDNLSDAGTYRSRASSHVIGFEKYETMLRLGISDEAIIVEMERDGFSNDDIADFFEAGPISLPPSQGSPSYDDDHRYYDDGEYYEDEYGDEYDDYPYEDYYDDGYDYDIPDPRYPLKYDRDNHNRPLRGDPPVSGRGGFKDGGRAYPSSSGGGGGGGGGVRSANESGKGNKLSSGSPVHAKPVTSSKLVRAVPARSRPVVKLNLPPPRRKGEVKTESKLDEKNTLHFKKMIEQRREEKRKEESDLSALSPAERSRLLEAQKDAKKHEADKLAHFSKIESVFFIRPSRARDVALHYQHPKMASKPKQMKQVRSTRPPKKEYLQGQDWIPIAEIIPPAREGPSVEQMTEVNHKQLVQELNGRAIRRQSN